MLHVIASGFIAMLLWLIPGVGSAEELALAGRWTSADRNSMIEIAACPNVAGALCATVLADQPAAGEPSLAGKQVGVNFAPARGGWAGQILTGDGSALPATITLPNATRLDLKVCMMAVFCDETSYYRADQ